MIRYSLIAVKPVQVYMADADLSRLEQWSREHGMNKSDAIRLAVRALTRPRATADPVLSLSGILEDDLPDDVAENLDRHLQETFVAERPATYARRRRLRPRR